MILHIEVLFNVTNFCIYFFIGSTVTTQMCKNKNSLHLPGSPFLKWRTRLHSSTFDDLSLLRFLELKDHAADNWWWNRNWWARDFSFSLTAKRLLAVVREYKTTETSVNKILCLPLYLFLVLILIYKMLLWKTMLGLFLCIK